MQGSRKHRRGRRTIKNKKGWPWTKRTRGTPASDVCLQLQKLNIFQYHEQKGSRGAPKPALADNMMLWETDQI